MLFITLSNSNCFSQDVQDYLNSETYRISQAKTIETEIENFISNNIANYSLPQSKIDEVTNNLLNEHHGSDSPITGVDLQKVLLDVKKRELRELYFSKNPQNTSYFNAASPPSELSISCINGDFESGIQGYTFKNYSVQPNITLNVDCGINGNSSNFSGFSPGTDQYQANASLVTTQNEPKLASLGVFINTTASGTRAIKLNPSTVDISNDGQTGSVTTMSRVFTINDDSIDFNFLQIGHVATHDGSGIFQYRLIDNATEQILFTKCYPLDITDCRYTQTPDTAIPDQTIAYSGWICERINTAMYMNMNVRLEFLISDCHNRGHYNTVYIDNLCGMTCSPNFGSINLDPVNSNCPSSTFNVCGTFQTPASNTLGNITLNIFNSSNVIISTLTNPTITGNTFCFQVSPSVFGSNPTENFEFEANATFNRVCGSTIVLSNATDYSANEGSDVNFENCCPTDLVITTFTLPSPDHKQASNSITASNTIANAQSGVYHAGSFVVLSSGFHSASGSTFRAYIEGCTDNYVGRTTYQEKKETVNYSEFETKENIITQNFRMYPNPAKTSVNIEAEFIITKIEINSIDGKLIFEKELSENDKTFTIDISNYKTGIYIVNIQNSIGEFISKKLVKN